MLIGGCPGMTGVPNGCAARRPHVMATVTNRPAGGLPDRTACGPVYGARRQPGLGSWRPRWAPRAIDRRAIRAPSCSSTPMRWCCDVRPSQVGSRDLGCGHRLRRCAGTGRTGHAGNGGGPGVGRTGGAVHGPGRCGRPPARRAPGPDTTGVGGAHLPGRRYLEQGHRRTAGDRRGTVKPRVRALYRYLRVSDRDVADSVALRGGVFR